MTTTDQASKYASSHDARHAAAGYLKLSIQTRSADTETRDRALRDMTVLRPETLADWKAWATALEVLLDVALKVPGAIVTVDELIKINAYIEASGQTQEGTTA